MGSSHRAGIGAYPCHDMCRGTPNDPPPLLRVMAPQPAQVTQMTQVPLILVHQAWRTVPRHSGTLVTRHSPPPPFPPPPWLGKHHLMSPGIWVAWGCRRCDPFHHPAPPNGPHHGSDMEMVPPPPPPPSETDQTLKKPGESRGAAHIPPLALTSPSLTPTSQCTATMGMHKRCAHNKAN